ncbi:hypothetical protein [Tropicimonas marinistellae]|uniref:hypothetical protein n=1 Tax=Tropicimonas marinistellae TaxID=1739787 RepID=UPI00082E7B2C|nr:hypothetical protein [Tropicimonas marinistellae]
MARFHGFVLFAEMRTGSNYLEETLNLFPSLQCHGEAFNPEFVGQPGWRDLFGLDKATRDADPLEMLRRISQNSEGLGGFRFFHDHDTRVLDKVLADPRIAKIILHRNPLDAYVSLKIAVATGQWRLTDATHRKSARVRFDPAEFEATFARQQEFRNRVRRALQVSGQTAFELSYEDTGHLDVVNGLAAFLGETHKLDALSNRLKRQNPAPLSEKVENFTEMQAALAEMNLSGLTHADAEAFRHAPAVQTYLVSPRTPLLFMPLKGGPTETISAWLAALDDVGPDELRGDLTQKSLRQWKNHNKDGRSFTVVSHPVARAHSVFCRYILSTGPGSFAAIRAHLREDVGLPLPENAPNGSYETRDHHAAFLGFLEFVRRNLSGQTRHRTDPAFSTQASLLQSMAEFLAPDVVIRADQLDLGLTQLCQQIGRRRMPAPPRNTATDVRLLSAIYDADVEAAVRAAYNRDYMAFGYRSWSAD